MSTLDTEKKYNENLEKEQRVGNYAPAISRKKRIIESILVTLSGVTCALAYPGTNFSFLAWIAIIPLFAIALTKTPGRAWRAGYYWGLGWALCSFFWIREIELLLPLPLSLYLALFPAFWAYLIPFIHRQIYVPNTTQLKGFQAEDSLQHSSHKKELLFITTLAAWWVVLEWLRSWLFTGLPWNNLATTQWQNLSVIQICEYTGIYGVSFVIVFINLAVFHSYQAWKRGFTSGRYKRSLSFVMGMLLILVNFFLGSQAMKKNSTNEAKTPFTAAVIQGDIPQSRAAKLPQVIHAVKQYNRLTNTVLEKAEQESIKILNNLKQTGRTSTFRESSLLKGRPDIVIWPETAVPIAYSLPYPIGAQYRQIIYNLIDRYKTPFLIGTLDYKPENIGEVNYNSAFLITTDKEIAHKYHKKHIVPFGEFVPFADQFPWLVKMIGMGRGLSRGTSSDPIVLKKNVRAGTSICFEDIFPYIIRDQVLSGANMLLTITNDAWYPTSDEPEQHLANSIFRAIETRRPFVRCGNNSGSCVISELGEIEQSISTLYNRKTDSFLPAPHIKEEGYALFSLAVPREPPLTFYTRYGDVFAYCCLFLCSAVLLFSVLKWKAKKEELIKGYTGTSD